MRYPDPVFAMSLLPPLLYALVATAAAVPPLARRIGLLDLPAARRTHARPVARVGGIAVAIGLGVGLLAMALQGHGGLDDGQAWLAVLAPAAAFFVVGLLDDMGQLSSRRKFALQSIVAAGAVALGLRWEGAGLGPFGELAFGAATPLMTWLWIVAVVTMINFLDGLDLITATTSAVVLAACAGGEAGPGEGLLYAVALGAVLGFVPWNLNPARAFLGDAGTHLLGFLVATAALASPGRTAALPWALASAPLLPGVLDIGWGLVVKRRHGVPLARAHNQHMSQRLVHAGRSHARVALRYGALAVLALLMVGMVAPRLGLPACVGASLAILLAHLLHVRLATRAIPHRF